MIAKDPAAKELARPWSDLPTDRAAIERTAPTEEQFEKAIKATFDKHGKAIELLARA